MSSRLVFARLLETITDMEKDVGLADFTANEKHVYAAVVLLSNDTKKPVSIHDIRPHYLVHNIAMPTVYRSLNRLISAGNITHIGGERSGLYAITA
ncbi:helix-turn-helix domain-containing protein [Alphaproteobacteria bacterium]|nr:helix-turn-helix domain-containing protein [Alphaproteobacteria bacterium]